MVRCETFEISYRFLQDLEVSLSKKLNKMEEQHRRIISVICITTEKDKKISGFTTSTFVIISDDNKGWSIKKDRQTIACLFL